MKVNDSKYTDLETTLSAIGKEVFINFYYDFKDTTIGYDTLAKKLFEENKRSKSPRQGFRIPRARYIFENGLEIDALKTIIDSQRLNGDIIDKAKEILHAEMLSRKITGDVFSEHEQNYFQDVNNQLLYSTPESFQYDNALQKPKQQKNSMVKQYKRNPTVAKNALFHANYLCEINSEHILFKRKYSNLNYTEPHHLIPLSAADDFPQINLDREQNIVSLCSHCHNMLHYGADAENLLKILFESRKDLLQKIGIDITFEQLKKYYL